MLPTPKDCTACGSTDSTEDNPLICYGHVRTGVPIGWVHKDCRELLLKGIQAMDDDLRAHGIDVPDDDVLDQWEFKSLN